MDHKLTTILMFINVLVYVSCGLAENVDDFECPEIKTFSREFDVTEFSPYHYNENGFRTDLIADSVKKNDFGLYLNVLFVDSPNDGDYYCTDINYSDSIVDVNIYLKSSNGLDNVDVLSAFRNQGDGSRFLEDIFSYRSHLLEDSYFVLDLVNSKQIPDTAVFISELVFTSGRLHLNETDSIFFY